MAKRYAQSIADTAELGDVELLFYVDADDECLPEYKAAMASYPFVSVVSGKAQSISISWNVLAKQCTGNLLHMSNDDLIALTPDWPRIVRDEVAKFTDGVFVAWVDDDFKHESLCAFPIVSRRWYETLGYFTPPYFEFGYNDAWLAELGRMLARLHYIDRAVVRHAHFTAPVDPSPRDRTTDWARRDGIPKRDRELFALLEPVRDRDSQLLRAIMNPK